MDYWRERFSLEGGWWKGFWIEDSPALPAVILPAGLVAGVNLYAWLDSSV